MFWQQQSDDDHGQGQCGEVAPQVWFWKSARCWAWDDEQQNYSMRRQKRELKFESRF